VSSGLRSPVVLISCCVSVRVSIGIVRVRSRCNIHLFPGSRGDGRSCIDGGVYLVVAFCKRFLGSIRRVPRPQPSEGLSLDALVGCTIKLDVIVRKISSLEVSEPMQIDSTLHPYFERGFWIRLLAPYKVVSATAVRVRLVLRHLPVVVGGFTGAFNLDSYYISIKSLVQLQGRATGSDGGPSEIIPGAFVLPVADLCELLPIGLLNVFGSTDCISVIRDGDFDKLAIPSLKTGRIRADLNAETVLDPLVNCTIDVSDRVAVVLIGVSTRNLGDVGPHVELNASVVAASVRINEIS